MNTSYIDIKFERDVEHEGSEVWAIAMDVIPIGVGRSKGYLSTQERLVQLGSHEDEDEEGDRMRVREKDELGASKASTRARVAFNEANEQGRATTGMNSCIKSKGEMILCGSKSET